MATRQNGKKKKKKKKKREKSPTRRRDVSRNLRKNLHEKDKKHQLERKRKEEE